MNAYTKTTSYIAPMVKEDLTVFLDHGFINCYLGDNGYGINYPNHLYLRVSPKEFSDDFRATTEKIRNSPAYVADYDLPDREVMFVFKIDEDYLNNLKEFKKGKYSKIDKAYVEKAFKKDSKRYKILNQDPDYRATLEESLSVVLPENAELEEIPEAANEIFRFKKGRGDWHSL